MPWAKDKPIEEIRAYNRMNMARYRAKHPEFRRKEKEWGKQYNLKLKKRAMEKLGGVKCSNCDCIDIRILEVNHINGREYEERSSLDKGSTRNRGHHSFYKIIVEGKYTKPLNVLCRVCNALEYVKRKYNHEYMIKFIK